MCWFFLLLSLQKGNRLRSSLITKYWTEYLYLKGMKLKAAGADDTKMRFTMSINFRWTRGWWASDQVRTFWRQEISLTPPTIQMPDRPAYRTYNSVAWKFNRLITQAHDCSRIHSVHVYTNTNIYVILPMSSWFSKEMLWISFNVIYTVFAYLQNFAKVVIFSA